MVLRLSHVGLCVADLDRAQRFYVEAMGFRVRSELAVDGPDSARLLGLSDGGLRAVYLERDAVRLELLCFTHRAESADGASPRAMNAPGLTHLSFRVESIDQSCAHVERLGGRVLVESRIESPAFQTRAVFVTDPDGTRIELLEAPGDPGRLPGEPS